MYISDYQLNVIQTILLSIILLVVLSIKYKGLTKYFKRMLFISIHGLSKLFPKSKRIVIFGAENGVGFRGNPKYIFLEMMKNPDIRCIWIAKSNSLVSEISDLGYECYLHNSRKGIYFQLKAKLAIHSHAANDDFNNKFIGGVISYNTWHGVGLKKVWGANRNTFSFKVMREKSWLKRTFGKLVIRTNQGKESYVVSTSQKVSSYYPETFLTSKDHILELGQVRNDVFFRESEEDEQIPEWYKNGTVLLYMPTHRSKGKLDNNINEVMDFESLNQFCEKNNYTFVIKRHMYSDGKVPTNYKHIIDISNESYDPQFLLKYADLLVTDYSSCYTDYLLLDRPVVFYCYDLKLYLQSSNEMYHDYFDVTPGPRPMNFQDLLVAIEESMNDLSLYQQERSRVLDIFYSKENQNMVLEKQVNYIYENLLKIKS
ncbi:CDP-glycerol--poly(glycerophosphate) glycerophosphotransferase [Aquibacillus halophilus]|uniref:CDP-glycerol--poly(Glycerophosphate) glycerophosphotransferase n=1 Tax=Aquibacillus halophilus TaxID=930132 RepID=A0A6A8DJ08_9BACI|nr:CDP-glycerol glycerophosphotransferase family protein [Aquibacillus halophilus]MRH41292.1 CDP-glycerol--poly(glycerophosphate) glycerophosphotransferase [Aquibacillus halophilus]